MGRDTPKDTPALVVSLAVWLIRVGLSAFRAAAARHYFQTLDFLAHGFLEDGVGKEDQPVRTGVGVMVLAGLLGLGSSVP